MDGCGETKTGMIGALLGDVRPSMKSNRLEKNMFLRREKKILLDIGQNMKQPSCQIEEKAMTGKTTIKKFSLK